MITAGVLTRVLKIRHGGGSGTSFTLDVEGRQYLVTARHVVEGFAGGKLEIFHEGQWQEFECALVGAGKGPIDISVLAADVQLSEAGTIAATPEGITLGVQIFFLGFPYGLQQRFVSPSGSGALPLVKTGILSAFNIEGAMFLDGHNNPGFSGGPVVFSVKKTAKEPSGFRGVGVISAYPTFEEPVLEAPCQDTQYYIMNNPGIVMAYPIQHAIDLIELNPCGFVLSQAQ